MTLPSWVNTAPSPDTDPSVSIVNCLLKSGWWRITGSLDSADRMLSIAAASGDPSLISTLSGRSFLVRSYSGDNVFDTFRMYCL